MKIFLQKIFLSIIMILLYIMAFIPTLFIVGFKGLKKELGLITLFKMFWKEEVPIFGVDENIKKGGCQCLEK